MRKIKRLFRFWLPVFIWALIIFLFSSRPTKNVSEFYWTDFIVKKSAHIVVYGIFTALTYRALKENGVSKKNSAYWAILFSIFYGITDEFHQSFVPGRGSTLRDIIFDTIGASLAIYIIWNILPKAPKKLKVWAKDLQLL